MPRRRLVLPLLALAASLALPSGALAAAPKARARPTPKATGRIGLQVAGSWSVNGRRLAVTGRPLQIQGRVAPYIAGQTVSVRIWRGHTLIKSATVAPKPTHTKKTAVFRLRFTPERSGDVQVFAVHDRTDQQRRLLAQVPLSVVVPKAGPGTRSPFVALLQQRLAADGYATPQTGAYDNLTGLAVLAFRKVNGVSRVTTLTPDIVDRVLDGKGGFKVRYPQHGRHVEANLGWQVLALIDHGKVVRAYTTSSGKPSTPTVLGHFRFYMREPGTNGEGMVDSTYFIRGYAIHGYFDVPTYNASHGCLRVPIPDAPAIFAWIHIGDGIDVYY
ncbi:MAG TPA: L,D-transpeptidase family protein [Conexibacter sp.]|nr:L,D-transpeptidase family protein [Conexibacter sp.]